MVITLSRNSSYRYDRVWEVAFQIGLESGEHVPLQCEFLKRNNTYLDEPTWPITGLVSMEILETNITVPQPIALSGGSRAIYMRPTPIVSTTW